MDDNISFRHQMPAQLRFSDVDTFGHVNNSVYFSLFDMCKTRYFTDVVGPGALDEMSIVVANIEATFLRPIFYPDEIDILTAITRLGNKSFTLCQRVINRRTREVKCECQTVMVCYNARERRSMAMPETFKAKIRAYEHGES